MPLPSFGDKDRKVRLLTAAERELLQRLNDDLLHYAQVCLQIRTKAGAAIALAFNRVQLYLHERLEEQRRRTGRVRALVLKFRQPGVSTCLRALLSSRDASCGNPRLSSSPTGNPRSGTAGTPGGRPVRDDPAVHGSEVALEDYATIFLRGSYSFGLGMVRECEIGKDSFYGHPVGIA
jgi:hypothetical protein